MTFEAVAIKPLRTSRWRRHSQYANPMKAIALLPSALLAFAKRAGLGADRCHPKEIEVRDEAVQVTVSNQGDRPEYVSVSLSRLLNPGAAAR